MFSPKTSCLQTYVYTGLEAGLPRPCVCTRKHSQTREWNAGLGQQATLWSVATNQMRIINTTTAAIYIRLLSALHYFLCSTYAPIMPHLSLPLLSAILALSVSIWYCATKLASPHSIATTVWTHLSPLQLALCDVEFAVLIGLAVLS